MKKIRIGYNFFVLDQARWLIIVNNCQLTKQIPIVVGVSGGADSLCLLSLFSRHGFQIIAAHFNHQLRMEAGEDERKVKAIAQALGIECVSEKGDVAGLAQSEHRTVEEAARLLRYRFLFDLASTRGAQAVAVGHTADDQVETVLMHLLRGSGLAGLKGMDYRQVMPAWHDRIPLIRPLLDAWHVDTVAYCDSLGLTPLIDPSNDDLAYQRNRIRHALIPYLEAYNPALRQAIWRSASNLKDDFQWIEQGAALAWDRVILSASATAIQLNRDAFTAEPVSIQRALLRNSLRRLRPSLDISLDAIERGREFIARPSRSGMADLVGRLVIRRRGNRIEIAPWEEERLDSNAPAVKDQPVKLPVPGKIAMENGWVLEATLCASSENVDWTSGPFQAWLDLDALSLPLTVRRRRPGDRWQPFGLSQGTQKISDFFVNVKLEAGLRSRWPLVCSGDAIAWVPGYRIGHPFRVTEKTRQPVRLTLARELP